MRNMLYLYKHFYTKTKKNQTSRGQTDRSPTASFSMFKIASCQPLSPAKKITAGSSCPAATARAARLVDSGAMPQAARCPPLSSFTAREPCGAPALMASNFLHHN